MVVKAPAAIVKAPDFCTDDTFIEKTHKTER